MLDRIKVRPRLHEILKERGMTQMQLAEMSGVSIAAVNRFDKNVRHEDAHLFAIARALNLRVEELFEVEYLDEKFSDRY